MIADAQEALRLYGPAGFAIRSLLTLYRLTLRNVMPAVGSARFAGVAVAEKKRWGDEALSGLWPFAGLGDIPLYEKGLVDVIRGHVRPGDRVVIVGGGIGVTVIHSALAAGAAGKVTCFEGSLGSIAATRETIRINTLPGGIDLRHAIVGRNIGVYGAAGEAAVVPPAELPECDVLELDCEGAELDIIAGLGFLPRVILVETHGFLGASTDAVRRLLEEKGYRVSACGVAEPRLPEFCEARDIKILVGEAAAARS